MEKPTITGWQISINEKGITMATLPAAEIRAVVAYIEFAEKEIMKASPHLPLGDDVLNEIRKAFADYHSSEGCSCCQRIEPHREANLKLGKLLKAEMYGDGSGVDWSMYKTSH